MTRHKHVGDTPLTKKAIAFAIEHHAGQTRSGSGLPYIVHPIEVYVIVRKYKESAQIDILGAAALLHDTLEDCPEVTYDLLLAEFGQTVADIVQELTNDREAIAQLGKQEYLEQKLAKLSSYALTIKLADILANVGENPTPKAIDRMAHHYNFLMSHPRTLSDTHECLLDAIRETLAVKGIT